MNDLPETFQCSDQREEKIGRKMAIRMPPGHMAAGSAPILTAAAPDRYPEHLYGCAGYDGREPEQRDDSWMLRRGARRHIREHRPIYKPVLLRLLVPKSLGIEAHTAARKSETDAISIWEPTSDQPAVVHSAAAPNVVADPAADAPEHTTANAAEPSSAEPVVANGSFGLAGAQMDGAALLRCRLRHLLAEAGASITVPLPRRERLALLGALCSTVEELPEPELGQRLVTLARHEIDMLRAERHERAMLGVRNRIWLLLAEVVRAVADGDRATMMELRRAARHELRRGAPTSAVATLLRMVDDKGARLDTVAPSLQTGRRCPKDAWGRMPDICDTLPSQAQLCSMSVNFDGVRWQSAGLPLRRQSSGLLGRYGPN